LEALDRLIEQAIEIQFRRQMQEDGAETDGGTVHEHELARHCHGAPGLERLVYPEGLLPPIFRWLHPVGDRAHAIIEQRPVNEPCPDVERVDQIAREPLETPGLVGVHDQCIVLAQKAPIKIDHAADKARRENPDASVVQENYSRVRALWTS